MANENVKGDARNLDNTLQGTIHTTMKKKNTAKNSQTVVHNILGK